MIVGLIPARGGSKGIPRKNIKPIAGYPLIYWTIQAAKFSNLLNKFYISTEDNEIASIALSYGCEVIKRPIELAQDDTTTLAVLRHVIQKVKCDTMVVLQPTSPLRDKTTIDDCILEFKTGGYDTLATGYYTKIVEYGTHQNLRRQDIQGFFYDDGNIYILDRNVLEKNRWFGKKIFRKILDKELSFEIDDDLDFLIVEHLLNIRLKSGKQISEFHESPERT